MNTFKQLITRNLIATALATACFAQTAIASELVYQPVNPSFGGSPLNGTFLLGTAQAINKYTDPNNVTPQIDSPSELDRLAASLQSRLISQLLADVGDGTSGSLTTDQFNIIVSDGGNGTVQVRITDLLTGETTNIGVNNAVLPQ